MKTHRQWWNWAVAVVGLALTLQAPLMAKAQDAQVQQDSPEARNPQGAPDAPQDAQDANTQDPPGRVARLNYMDGSVSFQPGGENDWVTAVLNRPLVTGDNLWADESSRAEVHIGSTALRLGAKTGISLLEVSDRAAQIRLAQGSLIVRVRHVDDEDTYEVDTPNIALTIRQPGEYKLDVNPDGGRTDVTVWNGRGEVTGGGSSYTVVAGQRATFTGTDQLNYELGQVPREDEFESWAFARDDHEDHADSANYVSREMTGYEDLDEYGDWSYVAGYGTCWRPRLVVGGWAPYRFGHWAWVGPWGWTWVEDEPWGFAPFHYGRWAFAGAGWFWVPGPVVVRPIYAPALVAWVGGGPGFGFSFSFGAGVGWFPLAPGEVFIPGYRVSRFYVNNVNITNTRVDVTRVTNVYNSVVINRRTTVNNITYVNRNVNGGVTVVSRDTFVNARPVARNVQTVSVREIQAAPVSHMASVEPGRQSVLGAGRPVVNKPPAAVVSRQVVARRTPAPMPRSFDQRQAQAGGRLSQQPLVRQEPAGQSRSMPSTQPSTQPSSRPSNQAARPSQPEEGFRPFGQANGDVNQQRQQPSGGFHPAPQPEQQSTPGWSHPLARPVAPVQQRSAEQEQQQEQKFHSWQQQRPAAPQRQQSRPAPPPRQEKPSKKGH